MSTNRKKAFKTKDYLKHEEGTIYKRGRGNPAIALLYPNTYFLGMSNLGFQSLYALFNQDPRTICERAFLPDDFIYQGKSKEDLRTLEHSQLVRDFDCVAFSISFENDYLYVLNMLGQAGLPFHAKDRDDHDPIVIAGGAALTINPEPIRPFLDIIFVGEAEDAAIEIIEALRDYDTRDEKIAALGKIEGCYIAQDIDFSNIPATTTSICPASTKPNVLEPRMPLAHLRHYKRRVPDDINGFPIESIIHTPYSEFGKLSLIEVQRGCGRGCKFCAEGFIYTPFRERSYDLVKEQVLRGLKHRDKIGLIGADLLVYPQIVDLMNFIHEQGGTFSPSSVRVDALTDEIIDLLAKSGHKTLAIAPEAGSEELRRKTNKKFDNASILKVIEKLILAGISNIKMYLMIGLPFEKQKDIDELISLVDEARNVIVTHSRITKKAGNLIISINPFIPKPRTPYQVGNFAGIDELENKIKHIKKQLLPKGGIRIYHENPFFAYIQALLSNGTTKMSEYLLEVYRNNGSLRKSLKIFENDNYHGEIAMLKKGVS
jgi:radical SAM superfamily enzyme YgiQ (UPF0313 family)